jgi:uncharacterized membrane protein YccF (DUF307 family)
MRLIPNAAEVISGSLRVALGSVAAGILIVANPFSVAAFRIGMYALWPFRSTVVDRPGTHRGATVGKVTWAIPCGIWLAIAHLMSAIAMAMTINGIPLVVANSKWIPVCQFPLGKAIVPSIQGSFP